MMDSEMVLNWRRECKRRQRDNGWKCGDCPYFLRCQNAEAEISRRSQERKLVNALYRFF